MASRFVCHNEERCIRSAAGRASASANAVSALRVQLVERNRREASVYGGSIGGEALARGSTGRFLGFASSHGTTNGCDCLIHDSLRDDARPSDGGFATARRSAHGRPGMAVTKTSKTTAACPILGCIHFGPRGDLPYLPRCVLDPSQRFDDHHPALPARGTD